MRRIAIVLIAATMLALAASGASAQVWCTECYRAYLPVAAFSEMVQ